ncbi:MAG: DUF5683 domain-containing protein [Armatimonadota bacterium]|nr:DUF5683 domain-containing protein [Armatimonadota bacterium]
MSNPEDIQKQATLDRLLSACNAHRVRGDLLAAEDACREVLQLDPDNLRAGEMLGDLLHGLGKLDEARKQYRNLLDRDGSLAAIEKKYARVALEIGQHAEERRAVEQALSKPEDKEELRRNAALAMVLSAAAPGVGQMYNGEFAKGAIIFAAFLLSIMVIAFSGGTSLFVRQMLSVLSGGAVGGSSVGWPSIWLLLFLGAGMFAYIYGVVDAPVSAIKKGQRHKSLDPEG